MHMADASSARDNEPRIAQGLAKIGLVLRHHAWRMGGEAGLTPTQSQVLAVLAAKSSCSVSGLAAELAVTQPTISDAVSALKRKKFVDSDRAAEDRRVVRVRLTAAGRRAAKETGEWPDFLLRAIASLEESERGVFVRGLIKMIRSLQESGEIPLSRMCPSCVHFRPHAHPGAARPHHCAYVDAPLGDVDLRIDCREHGALDAASRPRVWKIFIEGRSSAGMFPTAPGLHKKGV